MWGPQDTKQVHHQVKYGWVKANPTYTREARIIVALWNKESIATMVVLNPNGVGIKSSTQNTSVTL